MKPFIVFLGPPGSGKSTQSKLIADEYGYKRISTGDLIRDEIKNKTDLGISLDPLIQEGLLVPDKYVNHLFHQNLERSLSDHGIVIDGYPRTVSQAEYLDFHFMEAQYPRMVVYITVDLSIAEQRLLDRNRSDDEARIIETRFIEYEASISHVLTHWKEKTIQIDGGKTPELIYQELQSEINKRLIKSSP